jgi:hypothetical protein
MAKRSAKKKEADVEILPPPVLELVPPAKHGTLIVGKARAINREELQTIHTPEATATHRPIAHHTVIDGIEEALSYRHISIVASQFAVSKDGQKMFGLLEVNQDWEGIRYAIACRNAHDKSMRLSLVAGYRVMICSNMAISGEFRPAMAKHSKHVNFEEVITIAIDRVQRHFKPMQQQIQQWKDTELSDDQARLVLYKMFVEGEFPKRMLPDVHKHYFQPQYEAFEPRNLWSLSNALTSAVKEIEPTKQYMVTAKIPAALDRLALTN